MEVTEDKGHLYIQIPRRSGDPDVDAASKVILSGQGWQYSRRCKAWRRANNKEGQSSLALVTKMLEKTNGN